MTLRGFCSDLKQARRDPIAELNSAAKGYQPKGISSLAKEIGRSEGVLHNKFSEADERYNITDREADALALLIAAQSGNLAYIDAKCDLHGGLFVPLPQGEAADDDVLQGVLDTMRHAGDLARELTEARQDGRITQDEFAILRSRGHRMIASVHQLLKEIETQVVHQDDKPAGVALARVG